MMWWPLFRNSILLLLIVPSAEHVVSFSLPGCNSDNNFEIVQNQQPSLTCFGLSPGHNIYWSISDPSGQKETRLAECKRYKQGCSRLVEGYNVSRESRNMTTLQFLNASLVTDGSTIKCSRFNNKTDVTCQLYVVPDGKTSSAFPVTAVAGGVAGFISLVAVVVVIVVVFTVRRPKQEESPRREETASTHNGAADNYDGLHMPDVGLPSVYSETGPRPVSSSSSPDYIDLYHGLDMSEVGQRSEYSQLGQNI